METRLTIDKFASVMGECETLLFVYYESMERKLLKPIYECWCNGRLQTKRLTNEKFVSVKGECEI